MIETQGFLLRSNFLFLAGLVASGAVSVVLALRGLLVVWGDRLAGYVFFRRAVLVSLLVMMWQRCDAG